ncbi:agmatinase, mitochondrial [Nematostella vectensis]|uniref:agmatinase, mitochondrial n=1 Tax=Nematostella vectensis TaxID=45351 RepID=UPI00138FF0E5|nr:agmatinase, mitochondrial [Nematostella vectensis]
MTMTTLQIVVKTPRVVKTLHTRLQRFILHGPVQLRIRTFATCQNYKKEFNVPLLPDEMVRPGGICTMMRLPYQKSADGLDACFIGIPSDAGASNRPGARFGPRQIRVESSLIRPYNPATGAAPFKSLMVADIGDIQVNPYNLRATVDLIHDKIAQTVGHGCRPIALGGDHSISYPILKAISAKHGPVGMVHVDAHTDTATGANNVKIFHGSPFYWAVEEGLLDPRRVVQIGLRGPWYDEAEYDWATDKGFRLVFAKDCWHKCLDPLMGEVRAQMGDGPVYISFDIDGLDPVYAPGTGTPEVAGLTSIQAMEIVRGCRGLDIVGCDLVEVSPPYDASGMTALLAANILFEMLCVLPGVKYMK